MGKNIVDLHVHSIYSDGCLSPEEIIELAKKESITTLAITDHDNIEGSKELIRLNPEGINIYSGVELTAKANKGRMHILGYNIDLENEKLNEKLKEMKDASIYNIMLYVELLKKYFAIIIPEEELNNLLSIKGNIGRPQLALLLIKLGYCRTVDEAFNKYLIFVYEKTRTIKKGLTKEECIDLITSAGGIASLAHFNSLKMSLEELKNEILSLKFLGLGAIESTHINLSDEERSLARNIATEYNLLETGGTDYHCPKVKPDVYIGTGRNGNVLIPENTLSLTKKYPSRYN